MKLVEPLLLYRFLSHTDIFLLSKELCTGTGGLLHVIYEKNSCNSD